LGYVEVETGGKLQMANLGTQFFIEKVKCLFQYQKHIGQNLSNHHAIYENRILIQFGI
jgi:hypothetical protein